MDRWSTIGDHTLNTKKEIAGAGLFVTVAVVMGLGGFLIYWFAFRKDGSPAPPPAPSSWWTKDPACARSKISPNVVVCQDHGFTGSQNLKTLESCWFGREQHFDTDVGPEGCLRDCWTHGKMPTGVYKQTGHKQWDCQCLETTAPPKDSATGDYRGVPLTIKSDVRPYDPQCYTKIDKHQYAFYTDK